MNAQREFDPFTFLAGEALLSRFPNSRIWGYLPDNYNTPEFYDEWVRADRPHDWVYVDSWNDYMVLSEVSHGQSQVALICKDKILGVGDNMVVHDNMIAMNGGAYGTRHSLFKSVKEDIPYLVTYVYKVSFWHSCHGTAIRINLERGGKDFWVSTGDYISKGDEVREYMRYTDTFTLRDNKVTWVREADAKDCDGYFTTHRKYECGVENLDKGAVVRLEIEPSHIFEVSVPRWIQVESRRDLMADCPF